MNVLSLHTHDTGRWIEPYGVPLATPNLSRFARQATLFRRAFSMAPTCSPSRAAMLTGEAPHSCGMLGLAHRGYRLSEPGHHLVPFLNGNGFKTVLCGFQHEAPAAADLGYQTILAEPPNNHHMEADDLAAWDEGNAERAARYIRDRGADDAPLFFSYGMATTHREFPEEIDPSVDPRYLVPPPNILDTPATRDETARFYSSVLAMDRCFGRVLGAFEEAGMLENTVVMFTTDHGISFPLMKSSLFDTGIGVSLIMDHPGNRRRGQVSDALVSHLDVFPTLCDILGLESPDRLQGRSFAHLFDAEAPHRNEVFAEINDHVQYDPTRCIRTDHFKLIRLYGDDTLPRDLGGGDASLDLYRESGYLKRPRDRVMLFDLRSDPMERVNLADDPSYRAVRADLESRLDGWMTRTDDPLAAASVHIGSAGED